MSCRPNYIVFNLFIILSTFPYALLSSIVIPGNSTIDTQSFTFPVSQHARNGNGNFFFVGAAANGGQEYAISRHIMGTPMFESFALQQVTLDGQDDQLNPLYDQTITQLAIFAAVISEQSIAPAAVMPLAVTAAEPANIYYVQQKTGMCESILSAKNVKDATGINVTSGIIGLSSLENQGIFAAVLPSNSASFGDPGSGIAVISFDGLKNKDTDVVVRIFKQLDADPAPVVDPMATRAAPLDRTTPAVLINTAVASISNIVDMFYDTVLKRLYIALAVQANVGANDGARSIVVARMENNKLLYAPIAPDAVFNDQTHIVGTLGSNAQVTARKVRVMHTSTTLSYLIVLGGNGDATATASSVFALPLVDQQLSGEVDANQQGTLANVLSQPEDFFLPETNCFTEPIFSGRAYTQPATTPAQAYTTTSAPAIVGGGNLPYGPISDINVQNDVVFVSVAEPIGNQLPGIFASQALFDQGGVIVGWTPWARVAGTTDAVVGFSYQMSEGTFLWMQALTPTTSDTIKVTQWGTGFANGVANMIEQVAELLPETEGGVQALFDLPITTPGVFDISLYLATGLKKVLLIESGEIIAGVLIPNVGDFSTNLEQFTTGEITLNYPLAQARIVAISGGALDDLGPIIAATIGTNTVTNQGYLFVGGVGGAAMLAQADGSGWSTASGLGINFAGLSAGMRFIPFGDYSFVRALIVNQGFLYVLHDTGLDRITIATSDFVNNVLDRVTVATLESIEQPDTGTLVTVAISGDFALLGASSGLYRVGDNANIATASNAQELNWTQVAIPEGINVVRYLQLLATDNIPNHWAQSAHANLYITDAYLGYDTAALHRYAIVPTPPITMQTILPLADMRLKGILSAFRYFGAFRDFALYDGTDLFSARDRFLAQPPFVQDRNTILPLQINQASIVSGMLQSSASGSWLVSGDFGLRINE
jgi:hypothetical protein